VKLLVLVLGEFMSTIDKKEKEKEEWDYLECLPTWGGASREFWITLR